MPLTHEKLLSKGKIYRNGKSLEKGDRERGSLVLAG